MAEMPSEIRDMPCPEIESDMARMTHQSADLEKQIEGNRKKNQTAWFLGMLFPPTMLAVENDKPAKSQLNQNQARRDHLIVASSEKGCSSLNRADHNFR